MRRILMVLVALAFAVTATPALAKIDGSPHDYSDVGSYGLCQVCHVPHAVPTGNARLWRESDLGTGSTAWSSSTVGQLCGTCHDGGGLNAASNGTITPSQQTTYAYATTSHGRTVNTLTGAIGDTAPNDASRPYMTAGGNMECTSCHNVHFQGDYVSSSPYRPFLRVDTTGNLNTMSKFCSDCHDRYNTSVGASNSAVKYDGSTATRAYSMHPVDIAYDDVAGNNTNGGTTQLKAIADGTMDAVAGPENWPVDGARGRFQGAAGAPLTAAYDGTPGSNYIGCQTCHAIHNPAQVANNDSDDLYLLAVENTPVATEGSAGAPLCETCHGGGDGSATMYVGALKTALDASGNKLDDHPIDMVPDGVPALTNWSLRTRQERNPTITGQSQTDKWPAVEAGSGNAGALLTGSVYIGRIVCTSCHSAHVGVDATSINRTNADADWCFSCHPNEETVPANHHSTLYETLPPSGGNYSSSAIECGDCHNSGATGLSAHMGFFSLAATVRGLSIGSNTNSELCVACHNSDQTVDSENDPVYSTNIAGDISGNIPNGYLDANASGTLRSHYLGSFSNATNSINVKTGPWMASNANAVSRGGAGSYSKYGTTNNLGLNAPDLTSPVMICESCHSVLYNAGNNTLAGGYNINLLLQNYTDDASGSTGGAGSAVGSGFCVACHNQNNNTNGMGSSSGSVADTVVEDKTIAPASMHPMTNWTITRAVDAGRGTETLITTSGTYADASGAPGYGSYPASDEMDCDSCHRPHMAWADGTWQPQYQTGQVSVILEYNVNTGGDNDYGPFCQQCHNM